MTLKFATSVSINNAGVRVVQGHHHASPTVVLEAGYKHETFPH